MIARFALLAPLVAAVSLSSALPAASPTRVRLQTSIGPIVIELATKQAPITTANFLAYVDQKRFDGTSFYRAARSGGGKGKSGLIQGGIRRKYTLMLIPIAHEPTSVTGLTHSSGTISMARNAPGTAMGDFFIAIGDLPHMDARPGNPGYAAFGHVVSGMGVVRRILAARTTDRALSAEMRGQMIEKPIAIVTAQRVK